MSDANIDRYDAGLLGDGGGGNVEWWHDYLRAELSRAHEFYARQMAEFFEMLEGMKTGVGTRVGDLESEITSLRTELAAMRERVEWRPIETAPRDGSEVLLLVEKRAGIPGKSLVGHWMPGGHCIEDHPPIDAGWYFWNGCSFDRASKPLKWLPLPPIPTDTPKETGE